MNFIYRENGLMKEKRHIKTDGRTKQNKEVEFELKKKGRKRPYKVKNLSSE
jgi:hypothetical protein